MNPPHPEDSPRTAPLPANAAARALGFALDSRIEETSGVSIGPYKLLQKLGEGGFGVVWMAEQTEPIRRRVAIKIIKIGMDTEEVIARFEAERQALALMEHPNIARVFDAGATEAGRPYFVMELVRGVAITRYCDENKLPAAARLRLFVTVCQAVQHAHQKGVIHRDLKPSNILVTLHDGVPVPKIIDFGIAKATSGRLTDKTLFTQFHTFIGTPAYTSPEQMEMSGLDIDTRSDIYSLGVLLYELLTGQPPFDSEKLAQSGLEAMRRTIREIDPPRPSHRLDTLTADNRTSIAQHRGTDPAKLSLLLRGDLDWIAMRCLEKDRTRRYDSATSLAADIERHLNDQLVEARPPSRVYQAKKFVRRHKVGVAAITAVTLSLVAGLIASSTLLVRERDAHNRALAAQNRARSAEEKERELHRQAEVARADEEKRSARTALDLANRTLAEGRIADGLAYLVYAARKNPLNRTLVSRLASVLASNNFMIPRAAPLRCDSRVLAVRFAQDGRSFFVGTADGTFRVLDAATGAVQRQFQLDRQVVTDGWLFARDTDTVVGARFSDNTFALYDVATGMAKFPPLQLPPALGLPDTAGEVGLSPSGRWIHAVATRERWLWDAASGALRFNPKFSEHTAGFDFSPSEDTLALIVGHAVERWTLPAGQPVGPRIQYRPAVTDPQPFGVEVRYSPDGRRLAVIGRGTLQVFDSSTGALLHTLPYPGTLLLPASAVFVANDRLRIRTRSHFGSWNLGDGKFTASPLAEGPGVSFDTAGKRGLALSQDGLWRVFDIGSSTPVAEPTWRQSATYCAALSPDGTQVLLGTLDGLLYRFSLGGGAARPLVLPRPQQPTMPAPFLPDLPARLLVLAGDHAKVIEVASGREIAGGFRFPERVLQYPPHDTHPHIRPDLKFMVVRTERSDWQSWELGAEGVTRAVPLREVPNFDHIITLNRISDVVALGEASLPRVWNLRSGAPVGPPLSFSALPNPRSLSLSPDGRRLAMGARDGSAVIFDVATGLPGLRLRTRQQVRIAAMRFSPDGERILTANDDGEVQLWNAVTGEPIGPAVRQVGATENPVFSRDGRWAAIQSPTDATLLDGRTGIAVGSRIPAGSRLVRFSPDGNRLGTAGGGVAQVWDVPSGEAVTEPLQHSGSSNAPEFSPDGRFLRTEQRNFYVWAVPPPLPEGTPTPEWLLELATLLAGQIVNDAGELVPATEAAKNVERLRHQIATLPADAPLADWGRWVLDDRADRPIAPGFAITPAEAEKLATTPSL